ncbi:hypothetical protein A5881_001562 [Enterococcus termitis]|nr:hypothetical protein A5881_002117 [Enterococcus termitis]
MFSLKRKKDLALVAPTTGEVINLDKVSDEVFSSRIMGDGFAIIPTSNEVVSPIDGEVLSIFPTKHALTIRSNEGLEILIHMGIDTVALKGEGFEIYVSEGDKISATQPIANMDLNYINEQNKETTIMILITNLDKKRVNVIEGRSEPNTLALLVK